jgi:hypothetical protein
MNMADKSTPQHDAWSLLGQLLSLSNDELGQVDPVVMNLAVARGVPALADLDIGHYVQLADRWADDLRARMPSMEAEFRQSPQDWRNDLDFFRLGLVCWYVDVVLGVAYREDQREATEVLYTDPTDLFLNGVMDTRRGTCANLPLLHVVLGRRIGLPVSLACVGSHLLCRFDDGQKTINIEATETGRGGFSSQTDEFVLTKHKVPAKAQACGSDLRAVTPREMLGLFLGHRARHFENTGRIAEAEPDYLLARYLFPKNRMLSVTQTRISVQCGTKLFEPDEEGHPSGLARWLQALTHAFQREWDSTENIDQSKEDYDDSRIDTTFQPIVIGAAN